MALYSPEQFRYTINVVDDSYLWGAHTVPRRGSEIVLSHLATGEEKRFYLAGAVNHVSLAAHMDSLTDDLMGQWFNKREKKTKKVKE